MAAGDDAGRAIVRREVVQCYNLAININLYEFEYLYAPIMIAVPIGGRGRGRYVNPSSRHNIS
jgi:hypothetical protein